MHKHINNGICTAERQVKRNNAAREINVAVSDTLAHARQVCPRHKYLNAIYNVHPKSHRRGMSQQHRLWTFSCHRDAPRPVRTGTTIRVTHLCTNTFVGMI